MKKMRNLQISRKKRLIITGIILVVVFAWSPWLTDDFAISTVVSSLGGSNQEFNYLGEMIPLEDVPKHVIRVPFGALVYFPSEAMFIVTFWGLVL